MGRQQEIFPVVCGDYAPDEDFPLYKFLFFGSFPVYEIPPTASVIITVPGTLQKPGECAITHHPGRTRVFLVRN